MRSFTSAIVLAAAALPCALAQTSTACDPTKKTCPEDVGLNSATYSADFTSGSSANASWSAAAYTTIEYGSNGAEFSIANKNQAPTLQTDFYFFFGRVDVKMRASTGQGIISSMVLLSDDLDEIDFEWLGGDSTEVQSNFFGKGNTTSYDRGGKHAVSNPQTEFHTYSFDWNSDRIEFMIDGNTVRTLTYNDPTTNGGNNYPQSPMRLKLGSWCGGCAGQPEGTIEWAGGKTTFGNDPYVMYVESVSIQNTNPADSYTYGDKTGSFESIKINKDGSSGSASGSSGSSSGSSSTASVTASATAVSSASSKATVAPTSSLDVVAISQNTAAINTKTLTGSAAASMTTASGSGYSNGTMTTSVIAATTEVPGSSPSGGFGSSSNGNSTMGGNGTSSSASASQTGTSGAGANGIVTGASLLSIALGFLLL